MSLSLNRSLNNNSNKLSSFNVSSQATVDGSSSSSTL